MVAGGKAALWASGIVMLAVTLRATPHSQAQAAAQEPAPAQAPKNAADARSESVLFRVCGPCHDWQRVTDSRRTKSEWESVIDDMFTRGATGSDDDYNSVLDYLMRHNTLVNVNRAPADEISLVLGLAQEEADAIVSFRTANGKIADFEALKKVKGVDLKKLDAARLAIYY